MTKKKITAMIIVLWLFAVFAAVVFAVNYHLVFVPSLAACAITVAADVPLISIIVAPEKISFGLLVFVSVYLRYKIIKSNRFIHGVQRNVSDREKALRAGRLGEALKDQIKPTLCVLITGGIDGVLDLMVIAIVVVMSNLSSPESKFLLLKFQVLFWCIVNCSVTRCALGCTTRKYETTFSLVILNKAEWLC